MAFVVGPMEPATKRGLPGVENSSAAWRASAADCLFNACASAASPYSANTKGVPPKLLVSTMSEPASKYFRWTSSTTSGRVRTRFSLQPSRAGPPKSAAERLRCCSMVPIAPSSTKMRSASSSPRARSDSLRFRIRDLSFNSSIGATFPAMEPPPLTLIVYHSGRKASGFRPGDIRFRRAMGGQPKGDSPLAAGRMFKCLCRKIEIEYSVGCTSRRFRILGRLLGCQEGARSS